MMNMVFLLYLRLAIINKVGSMHYFASGCLVNVYRLSATQVTLNKSDT